MKSAAFAPSVAADNEKKNEMRVQGARRIVWSPVRIDLSDRRIGHTHLPAKEFVEIVDLPERNPNMSVAAFHDNPNDPAQPEYNHRVKTSMVIVDELTNAYGQRGVVHLASLDKRSTGMVAALEMMVCPDVKEPLSAIAARLQALDVSELDAEDTKTELLTALQASIELIQAQVQAWRAEYAARMRGETGIDSFTPQMKALAAEIGEELNEGQEFTIRNEAANATASATATAPLNNDALTAAVIKLAEGQAQLAQAMNVMLTNPPKSPNPPTTEAEGNIAPPDEAFAESGTKKPSVTPPASRRKAA